MSNPTAKRYRIPIQRVQLVRDGSISTPYVKGQASAGRILQEYFQGFDRETLVVMYLNRKHSIIGFETISVGTLSASLVHPREVFKGAILANADSIILAHNHPSGDSTPSNEDHTVSKRIADSGRLIGIELLDHLVVGDSVQSAMER